MTSVSLAAPIMPRPEIPVLLGYAIAATPTLPLDRTAITYINGGALKSVRMIA